MKHKRDIRILNSNDKVYYCLENFRDGGHVYFKVDADISKKRILAGEFTPFREPVVKDMTLKQLNKILKEHFGYTVRII